MVLGMQGLGLFLVVMLMWIVVPGCGGGGGDNPPQTGGGNVSQIEIKDLGPPFNLAAGARTGQISLDVPAGTSLLMLIADGGNTTADIDIEELINPTGDVLVDRRSTSVDPVGKNEFHALDDTLASGTLWARRGQSLLAGTYKFRVASYNESASAVQVHAIINHRENPTDGKLDVNLIFCGIPGLNKDNALADPQFQVLLNEFKRIYAQANIQVNVAGTFSCNDEARLTFLSTSNGEFGDLLAQSSMTGNQAMNFFFVQNINGESGPLGLAAKIEGPALLRGTRYSGVVVTTLNGGLSQLSQADLKMQGTTMAHEGGHFLGLYHTTERCGARAIECPGFDINGNGQIDSWEVVDPLPDTLECPSLLYGPEVSPDECLGRDGTNLMFWQASIDIVQDRLTADQNNVLQRNPYVH